MPELDLFAHLVAQVDVQEYDAFCDSMARSCLDDEIFLTKLGEFIARRNVCKQQEELES